MPHCLTSAANGTTTVTRRYDTSGRIARETRNRLIISRNAPSLTGATHDRESQRLLASDASGA
jgi:hypothetical protein